MAVNKYDYGVCGVFCGQCPSGNGRIQFFAQELKRLVDTTGCDQMEEAIKTFGYSNFRKGLEWFSSNKCPMCLNGGGAPCQNRKRAEEKKLESCLTCKTYMTCKNTEYQRGRYPFVIDNYNQVQEVGFLKHLEEEEEKKKAGVNLMGHLERKCCKVVKLE